ncbi:MAG: hypothetical protein ACE5I1_29750, partial [bacterium]
VKIPWLNYLVAAKGCAVKNPWLKYFIAAKGRARNNSGKISLHSCHEYFVTPFYSLEIVHYFF